MKKIIVFLLLLFMTKAMSQSEIIILSPRVGTIIDIHENLFYSVFPTIRIFISAQIYSTSDLRYKVRFVVNRRGKRKTYERKLSLKQFTRFQNKVNAQPELTEEAREIMYAGMDFLRAAEIIKGRFFSLSHVYLLNMFFLSIFMIVNLKIKSGKFSSNEK